MYSHADTEDLIIGLSVKLREIGMKIVSSPLENSHLNNMIQSYF